MKKLVLMLMLVLGMASAASAQLQISVNGLVAVYQPVISLNPSQTATLDIFTDTGIPMMTPYDMVLIVATSCGTITGGVALKPNESAGSVWYTAQGNAEGVPEGQDGGGFSTITLDDAIPAMTKIFDYITFHCESGNGDTIVTLAEINQDGEYTGTIYDTVTIHQNVPEPATIALLGLGGLLLRRRK